MLSRLLLGPGFSLFSQVLASAQVEQRPAGGVDAELICHTDNPADCYPKLFLATKEFQRVHPDQDLPLGLHVRLNIQTGEKEAKLNDLSEQDPSLAGLPVDRAVVVVDPEPSPDRLVHPGAPAYEAIGKIKEPPGSEAREFGECASAVARRHPGHNGSTFDDALEKLEELSHDIYFGLKIAEDVELLKILFCTMSTDDVFLSVMDMRAVPRARLAAAAIAAALQNNPAALIAAEGHWHAILHAACPSSGQTSTLGSLVFSTVLPEGDLVAMSSTRDPGPALVKAKLSAIGSLLKSPKIRQHFLDHDGMRQVLRVLLVRDAQYAEAQVKAANLITDTFLDENMGAVVGLWPKGAPSSPIHCESEGDGMSDDCWEYHVGRLAEESGSDPAHWSARLLALLKEQRDRQHGGGSARRPPLHNEL